MCSPHLRVPGRTGSQKNCRRGAFLTFESLRNLWDAPSLCRFWQRDMCEKIQSELDQWKRVVLLNPELTRLFYVANLSSRPRRIFLKSHYYTVAKNCYVYENASSELERESCCSRRVKAFSSFRGGFLGFPRI